MRKVTAITVEQLVELAVDDSAATLIALTARPSSLITGAASSGKTLLVDAEA
jgi:hypothetical protein